MRRGIGQGRVGSRPGRVVRGALWTLVVAGGCAAQQVVPVSVEPAPVEIFVDGRLEVSGEPTPLSLRVDRGHVILIRRPGYRTEQVVLESVGEGRARRLEPARIELRLERDHRVGRRLQVELDPRDVEAEGADDAGVVKEGE